MLATYLMITRIVTCSPIFNFLCAQMFSDFSFYGSFTEVSLRSVVMHELGHSIGLSHSQEEDSIMYSFYQYGLPPSLSYDDVLAVQTVYGNQKMY